MLYESPILRLSWNTYTKYINIKYRITDDESLSPLGFGIALIPLTIELKRAGYWYEIGDKKQISYYFIWMT